MAVCSSIPWAANRAGLQLSGLDNWIFPAMPLLLRGREEKVSEVSFGNALGDGAED